MPRKPKPGQSLAEVNPDLAKEWHLSKNGSLTPYDVSPMNGAKVWWKCDKGDDHEWDAVVSSRSKGIGCPICAKQKIVMSNCLATLNPQLASDWHPTKNGDLTPNDVGVGSHKKVWWKCDKGDDHVWKASVANRTNGRGCPICGGKKVVYSNCLATLDPQLASEWHPTKNGDLTPNDVGVGSHKKVWWKCDKGDDHEWITSVANRTKGNGCAVCANQKIVMSNCLATLNPQLASEWHPTKNGDLTPNDVGIGSGIKVWWKCEQGDDHEWISTVGDRTRGNGCAVCAGKQVVDSNCLATLNPQLASEWHPTKNGTLTPFKIAVGSNKKVWWKCDKGDDHVWKASVANRTNGRGCPICGGKKVVYSNCLATLDPQLASEWHPTKNGTLTPQDVGIGSGIKVWWKCDKGVDHEWVSNVLNRTYGQGCPYCTLTPQSKQELTITFELKQFFEIDPRGFKTRVKRKLWTIDIFIPEVNFGIEFDGSYWHKNKRDLDKLKTKKLRSHGFDILRVREEPLKKINDHDIISEQPFNAKKVTDDILRHILDTYAISDEQTLAIKKYFRKRKIQNEKGLNDYIDIILEEKAEKRAK